jgi:DNA repair exonuclease SbcCD ATPase subunit
MTQNNKWQEEFYKSMKEIDIIYNDTMEKLEKIHQKKMELIKDHKEKLKEDQLNKIRQEIKGADND